MAIPHSSLPERAPRSHYGSALLSRLNSLSPSLSLLALLGFSIKWWPMSSLIDARLIAYATDTKSVEWAKRVHIRWQLTKCLSSPRVTWKGGYNEKDKKIKQRAWRCDEPDASRWWVESSNEILSCFKQAHHCFSSSLLLGNYGLVETKE